MKTTTLALAGLYCFVTPPEGIPSSFLLLAIQDKFPEVDLDLHMGMLQLLEKLGLATCSGHYIRLTPRGLDLSATLETVIASREAALKGVPEKLGDN